MELKTLFLRFVPDLLGDSDAPEKYAWEKKRAAVYEALRSHAKRRIRLLDVGCDTGAELTKYSEILKGEFVGLDIELHLLSENKHKTNFLIGDARRLPFKDQTFDVVIATEVIEHFEEGEVFVKDIKRILTKDGIFILTTPNRLRFTARPRSLVAKIRGKKIVRGPIATHMREYTPKELRNTLVEAGFNIESVRFIAFNPSLRVPKHIFIYLDKFTDKFFGSFTKWDMLIVARG